MNSNNKIKFTDLKPGMMVISGLPKLIIEIIPAGTDPFWGDKDALRFIDMHDAYYGQCSGHILPGQEFEIMHEIGTEDYRKEIQRMINERSQAKTDARNDMDLLQAYQRLSD